jgi:hypothetical protein
VASGPVPHAHVRVRRRCRVERAGAAKALRRPLELVQQRPGPARLVPRSEPPVRPRPAGERAHALPGEHAPQVPAWQYMFVPQVVPSAIATCSHPFTESHESTVQGLRSSQSSGVPLVQAPATQVSAPSHRSPSAQLVPSAKA